MARTIQPNIPVVRERTRFYFHDHYMLMVQRTDGKNVPPVLYWLFFRGDAVMIRADRETILKHIHAHYEVRRQSGFSGRYEKVGVLPDYKLKNQPFGTLEEQNSIKLDFYRSLR